MMSASVNIVPSFEVQLDEHLQPIRQHFLAVITYHLFESGLYDLLSSSSGPIPIEVIVKHFNFDRRRTEAFLYYLSNEDIVEVATLGVILAPKGRSLGPFRPWYTMLIGGYSRTFLEIGKALEEGTPYCSRDAKQVGVGSCAISLIDAIPLCASLMAAAGTEFREMLDLGCGDASYLVEFCKAVPTMTAWGCEPSHGGYLEACDLIAASDMQERIRVKNQSATDFVAAPPSDCNPNLVVFGFVLHEVLGQEGEDAVVALLSSIVARFPDIAIIVIEVDEMIANRDVMRLPLARSYWNPYFLTHYFTPQRLTTNMHWVEIFERANLRVEQFRSVDNDVDSTNITLGYLLRSHSVGRAQFA